MGRQCGADRGLNWTRIILQGRDRDGQTEYQLNAVEITRSPASDGQPGHVALVDHMVGKQLGEIFRFGLEECRAWAGLEGGQVGLGAQRGHVLADSDLAAPEKGVVLSVEIKIAH
jgi:hypothetical protein